MELVDVLDSKSSAARRAGSSPATGTKKESIFRMLSFFVSRRRRAKNRSALIWREGHTRLSRALPMRTWTLHSGRRHAILFFASDRNGFRAGPAGYGHGQQGNAGEIPARGRHCEARREPPKSEDLPVPHPKGLRCRARIRGFPDDYGGCGQIRPFSLFALVRSSIQNRKESVV